MRVGFLYNAQIHHVLHSLPIACELSRQRDFEAVVIGRSAAQLKFARRLAGFYPGNRLNFELLDTPLFEPHLAGASSWSKRLTLLANRRRLNDFDALVVPERTSLELKWLGVTHPQFIHTFHGSSGHDRVTDRRLRKFDLLLAPSARRLERIRRTHGVAPQRSTVIGYVKLDLVSRMAKSRDRLGFDARPIVLYNPHHWADKSSWPLMGRQILRRFRDHRDFNCIFAPHLRLFDPPDRYAPEFQEFQGFDHLHVDLGSERSVDMTYSLAADIYLGDVSSQAFEFALRPRPCIFLNPHERTWHDDENFASWRLGRVVDNLSEMNGALAGIDRWRDEFDPIQRHVIADNFPKFETPAPLLGARAIAAFLRDRELRPGWSETVPA